MEERERAETENDQAMKLAPDEDLMLEVRNGSGETLGVLFDRYHSPLFNFYSKLTGDRTLSDDLVQEVFLRILKYRQSYEPGTPFRAWIYQIARNARVDSPDCPERESGSLPEDTAAHHLRARDGAASDAERFGAEIAGSRAAAPRFDADAGRETRDFGFEPVSGIEVRRNCAVAWMRARDG